MAQGKVISMRTNRKALQLDDGQWYSSFNPLPEAVAIGTTVSFDFQVKGSFNNIRGAVRVVSGTEPAKSQSSPAPTHTPATKALPDHYLRLDYATLVKEFPIPPTHPDRAIIRQNSLSHAVTVWSKAEGTFDGDPKSVEKAMEFILDLASQFEKYSTGDLEREQVEQMMATQPEVNNG